MQVTVFASFTPSNGEADTAEQILRGMVGPSRAEPGCRRYDLYRIKEGDPTFHIFEIYDDQAALEHHRTTEHYKAYRAKISDSLAEPISVNVLTGVDVKDA